MHSVRTLRASLRVCGMRRRCDHSRVRTTVRTGVRTVATVYAHPCAPFGVSHGDSPGLLLPLTAAGATAGTTEELSKDVLRRHPRPRRGQRIQRLWQQRLVSLRHLQHGQLLLPVQHVRDLRRRRRYVQFVCRKPLSRWWSVQAGRTGGACVAGSAPDCLSRERAWVCVAGANMLPVFVRACLWCAGQGPGYTVVRHGARKSPWGTPVVCGGRGRTNPGRGWVDPLRCVPDHGTCGSSTIENGRMQRRLGGSQKRSVRASSAAVYTAPTTSPLRCRTGVKTLLSSASGCASEKAAASS